MDIIDVPGDVIKVVGRIRNLATLEFMEFNSLLEPRKVKQQLLLGRCRLDLVVEEV